MNQFLNYFFFVFHTLLVLFNTFGWIVKRWRRWHLASLLITAGSWFVLGIWYGWGYCPCTDWHWMVRRKMGLLDMSNSYNHFLVLKLTGVNFSETLVNNVTLIVFFSSLALSIWLNVRDRLRMKS